ncbi:copper resistance protein B [Sulfuriferula thiophila]|uniref:copper resistance protein B n=1 Tax=Sulfuriferula thiophila TaxID=1781211 RepID=UPI001677846A|nr:copper resistance protein B [Sulfuriferula thiophila]
MKNLKPLAQILLCTLSPLSGAVYAQDSMSMPMPAQDTTTPDSSMSGMDADSMKKMEHMPAKHTTGTSNKQHDHKQPAPEMQHAHEQSAPPVGSLPSSDGSAGKSYHAYDIGMATMNMEDNPLITKLLLDKLEYVHGDQADSMVWDGRFRIGYDLNKLWIRSEGQRAKGKVQEADAELLWGHTFAPYWDVVTGLRHDFGTGPARDWAAFGIQGLAPYKFDVEATAYAGTEGRAAVRLKTSYDLLLTQRLILTPEIDANLYSKDDLDRGIGAGLADTSVGLRIRFEVRREFAPYVGIEYIQKYGKTADIARTSSDATHDLQLVAGARIWF